MVKKNCPHETQFCPLYVMSHEAGSEFACCTGDWAQGCAVERGEMDYDETMDRLWEEDPWLIRMMQGEERKAKAKEQIARNIRINGLH